MSKSKIQVAVFVVVFCVAAIVAFKITHKPQILQEAPIKQARVKGEKNAPVHIVEFIDFECPACAKGAQYLKEFMEKHPEVVYLEMKYFPLKMHKHAHQAAKYAECAARQGKFWPYHDYLIDKQAQWKKLPDAIPAFYEIAQDVGVDRIELDACLLNPEIEDVIAKDKEAGELVGLRSTPTYVINGQVFVGTKSLEEELAKYITDETK